mmetsp:Transcript_8434/g.26906  ORF Transcript_8434/g.26906 Transcript_8434/m.26906 type:complete len:308 (-) Transcript_8434:47-970(-)
MDQPVTRCSPLPPSQSRLRPQTRQPNHLGRQAAPCALAPPSRLAPPPPPASPSTVSTSLVALAPSLVPRQAIVQPSRCPRPSTPLQPPHHSRPTTNLIGTRSTGTRCPLLATASRNHYPYIHGYINLTSSGDSSHPTRRRAFTKKFRICLADKPVLRDSISTSSGDAYGCDRLHRNHRSSTRRCGRINTLSAWPCSHTPKCTLGDAACAVATSVTSASTAAACPRIASCARATPATSAARSSINGTSHRLDPSSKLAKNRMRWSASWAASSISGSGNGSPALAASRRRRISSATARPRALSEDISIE